MSWRKISKVVCRTSRSGTKRCVIGARRCFGGIRSRRQIVISKTMVQNLSSSIRRTIGRTFME